MRGQCNTRGSLSKLKRTPPQRKINVTSNSPVGEISVVTLIRTDTTLDHSQKAEKVCSANACDARCQGQFKMKGKVYALQCTAVVNTRCARAGPFRSIAQDTSSTLELKLWILPELRNVHFIFMAFCGSRLSFVSSGEHCRSDPVQVQSTRLERRLPSYRCVLPFARLVYQKRQTRQKQNETLKS